MSAIELPQLGALSFDLALSPSLQAGLQTRNRSKGYMEMMQCLRGLAEHAEDLSLVSGISADGSQPSGTPALGDTMASMASKCNALIYTNPYADTHIHK